MELTKTCEGVFIEQSYFLYLKESQPFSYSSVDYISETKKGIKECKSCSRLFCTLVYIYLQSNN